MSTFDERGGSKWDRAARYLRIAQVLHAHGETGISAEALAKQIGVSKRTVYRDLAAMILTAVSPSGTTADASAWQLMRSCRRWPSPCPKRWPSS